MVGKRGEGGTLIGGVSGSSAVIVLLVGSKKWTLVGVVGDIVSVGGGRGDEGGGGGVAVDSEGRRMVEKPGTSGRGLYIWTSRLG